MTITIGFAIIAVLLLELNNVCSTGRRVCDLSQGNFPTISLTIISYEKYNEVFLIATTLFTWGVVSSIVRSFYKMLHGKVSVSTNNWYMFTGYLIVASLPIVGILDCESYQIYHDCVAVLFFGSTGIYFSLVGNTLEKHIDTFPEEKQRAIRVT
jgi:hypothetical protein